jgi:hypothetical protein
MGFVCLGGFLTILGLLENVGKEWDSSSCGGV